MLDNKVILITGGTGFLGRNITKYLLENFNVKKIIVFSRDEGKQEDMKSIIPDPFDKIRYCLGDIRDSERLVEVLRGVDIVIHAAALKRVPPLEYNPIEGIKTNIIGTMKLIRACVKCDVKKVIGVSSDKSVSAINLYGGTKFILERLFQSAHIYSKNHSMECVCVRYGNVAGSSGSIIPKFRKLISEGITELPLTDEEMSRFWIDVKDACKLIIDAIDYGKKGDVFVPKLKSFYVSDLIEAMNCSYKTVGIREGEKLSEKMINSTEKAIEYPDYYRIIHTSQNEVNTISLDYDSADNEFMTVCELVEKLEELK